MRDQHARHFLRAGKEQDLILVSVFNPPLRGDERQVVLWIAGLFLLADLSMAARQRLGRMTLDVFEQHQDIWLHPLRIAFGHIRSLAELKKIIILAVGVNLIVGVTLATSAAMVIGQYSAGTDRASQGFQPGAG